MDVIITTTFWRKAIHPNVIFSKMYRRATSKIYQWVALIKLILFEMKCNFLAFPCCSMAILTLTSEMRALRRQKATTKLHPLRMSTKKHAQKERTSRETENIPDSTLLLFHTGCQLAIITGSWE